MATVTQWLEGARPRTLPNAIAPVLAGVGATIQLGAFSWWESLLALLVSLSLIIGVNFANDYSDGIRGTDAERVGPLRLVGSGAATPKVVLLAAFGCLGLAGLLGLTLVAVTGRWWLLAIGAACVLGAWFYTGGKKPYGYSGFGEIAVFVFFGLTAVLGTLYVQAGTVSWPGLGAAVGVGCFSTAVLTANNLRDIPTDRTTGKNTLAVRLGDTGTRRLYLALVTAPYVGTILFAPAQPLVLIALITTLLLITPVRVITSGGTGARLIPVLRDTGMAMLAYSLLTGVALALS
jgi:1,4-dihydroxy-2-naphthoate octaprenyltransferase